jgi:DNA mismatch repair protein MutS
MSRAVEGPGEKRSPAMQQFFRAKEQYPDALLFFRMGDFYELFHEDAIVAAKALDLALTSRQKNADGTEIPMAGVPHHAAAGYLARLVDKGFRVAICEQMVDPATVKGIVPREVVRVVTPGLAIDPDAMSERADNWLAVVAKDDLGVVVAAIELSRSAARVTSLRDDAELVAELTRVEARELLVHGLDEPTLAALRVAFPRARLASAPNEDAVALERAIEVASLDGFDARARGVLSRAVAYAQAAHPRASIRIALELDSSWSGPLGHLGVRRSPRHPPEQLAALASTVTERAGFTLVGMMAYEAQIAGLGDAPPGRPLRGALVRGGVRDCRARH